MSIIYDALKRIDKRPSQGEDRRIDAKKISIKKLVLPFLIAVAGITFFYTWQARTSLRQMSQAEPELKQSMPLAKKEPLKKPYSSLANEPQAFIVRDPFSDTSPFRLSGIIYSPNKPIAIVNRKTVSIGELVGGAKVSNIKEDSVELSLNDKKIILTLE